MMSGSDPEQREAVVLARLSVGRDPTGVVVLDHHDDPGADHREQRQQSSAKRAATALVKPSEIVPKAPRMAATEPSSGRGFRGSSNT